MVLELCRGEDQLCRQKWLIIQVLEFATIFSFPTSRYYSPLPLILFHVQSIVRGRKQNDTHTLCWFWPMGKHWQKRPVRYAGPLFAQLLGHCWSHAFPNQSFLLLIFFFFLSMCRWCGHWTLPTLRLREKSAHQPTRSCSNADLVHYDKTNTLCDIYDSLVNHSWYLIMCTNLQLSCFISLSLSLSCIVISSNAWNKHGRELRKSPPSWQWNLLVQVSGFHLSLVTDSLFFPLMSGVIEGRAHLE